MDYDGNGTLYHLNCGICGRTFWSHDAFANVCDECKGTEIQTDMVEVVRCKDCIFGEQINDRYICTNAGHCQSKSNKPDWFCADGKQKEGR